MKASQPTNRIASPSQGFTTTTLEPVCSNKDRSPIDSRGELTPRLNANRPLPTNPPRVLREHDHNNRAPAPCCRSNRPPDPTTSLSPIQDAQIARFCQESLFHRQPQSKSRS